MDGPAGREETLSHAMTYKAWVALRRRYSNGGAEICESWGHFESFFADMGTRPRGTKLVRIDNGKPFGRDNCIWKTTKRLRDGNGLDAPAEHVRWIKELHAAGLTEHEIAVLLRTPRAAVRDALCE